MRVIGFDSKKVVRQKPDFKALLGVGITLSNYELFCTVYNQVFDEIFKEYGFERGKIIYKSYDLLSIFFTAGIDVIPIVVEKLMPHIGYIDIFYSYFLPGQTMFSATGQQVVRPLSIGVFWEQEIKRLTAPEFIDLIEGAYPAICCYAYVKGLTSNVETSYFIDDCPGLRPSTAISTVCKLPSTKFLFKGDQTNYAISMADLVCSYLDQACLKQGIHFNKDMVQNIGLDSSKCKTTFVGPNWLRDIKPARNIVLNVNHKYPHPIFFFFSDKSAGFGIDAKEVITKSRLFRLALDKAAAVKGSVKFFEPSDQDLVTPKDFLVKHNELSDKKIEELIGLACQAKKIDVTFFNDNYKNI